MGLPCFIFYISAVFCGDVQIVPRDEWGALDPKEDPVAIATPLNMTFIHHTENIPCYDQAACSATCRHIQYGHMFYNGE